MENSQNKKPNKYVVLATYLVAVVCLLLGLFLPLWGDKGILALQLPDVFNKIANKNIISSVKKEFTLAYPVNFLGTGKTVDVMAWVALLYVVVTAFSVIALIPVGVGTKKGSKTASVFAYIVEIAAVIVTSVYVMIALQYQIKTDLGELGDLFQELLPPVSKFSYNMVIALGGCLLMLIILSILNKKGTGVAKLFLFLLSAVGLLALYDLSLIIPKLAKIKISPALFGNDLVNVAGINYLNLLFEGGFKETLNLAPATKDKAALMLATIVGVIAVLNYFIDVIGLSSNAKKPGYAFNLFRYGLEFVALVCLLITVAVCKYKFGLMLIVLPAAVAVQIIISAVRLVMFAKKAKNGAIEVEKVDFDFEPEPEPVYRRPEPIMAEPVRAPREAYQQPPEPVYMEQENRAPAKDKFGFNEPLTEDVQMKINVEPAKPAEPRYEDRSQPVPVQPSTPVRTYVPEGSTQAHVYTVNTIYGGPVDEFMRKLTNDEKIEFAMTFIEKSKGNIGNIPEYVIGGNNRLFFSSVFIYLGRIRGLISDGLLNKMYKELNML